MVYAGFMLHYRTDADRPEGCAVGGIHHGNGKCIGSGCFNGEGGFAPDIRICHVAGRMCRVGVEYFPCVGAFRGISHAELKDIVFVVGGTPIERTGRIQEGEVILTGFQVEAIGNQGGMSGSGVVAGVASQGPGFGFIGSPVQVRKNTGIGRDDWCTVGRGCLRRIVVQIDFRNSGIGGEFDAYRYRVCLSDFREIGCFCKIEIFGVVSNQSVLKVLIDGIPAVDRVPCPEAPSCVAAHVFDAGKDRCLVGEVACGQGEHHLADFQVGIVGYASGIDADLVNP